MFPVDPKVVRTNITSSVSTTRRGQFRDDVAARDGGTCVLTSMARRHCDAVHLLAHSKGDTYITTYTRRCSRDPSGGDIVADIDSVRNGLFLNKLTHGPLGIDVAFLVTPNFAMTTADVDPTAPPTERRCTAHVFDLGNPFVLGDPRLSSGSPIRISDTPEWPPAILFDAVYAGAVLHHFGTQKLEDAVAATWNDTFYPGGVMTAREADFKVIEDQRTATEERRETQAKDRRARHEARRPDTFDMLMTLPYIMVPRNELQAALREAKEKAEATEQRRVQEKVDTWMKQITAA